MSISITQVYVPIVAYGLRYDMEEDFESGTEDWEPFLNYWRLKPEQWYLQAGAGYDGSTGLRHSALFGVIDPARGAHHALYMYQGQGAEQWADYRLEARVQMEAGERIGLWFRGRYLPDSTAGLHVEGYYVSWQPETVTDTIALWRIPVSGTNAYHFGKAEAIATADLSMALNTWYHIVVKVRDDSIQVFVDGTRVLAYADDTYGQGTVGLYAYKANYATWDDVRVVLLGNPMIHQNPNGE